MIIKCGICGEMIDVQGVLSDGMDVLCPFCGETSVYKKPARIDISDAKPVSNQLPQKPKLKVIRPSEQKIEKNVPKSPTYEQLLKQQNNTHSPRNDSGSGDFARVVVIVLAMIVAGGTLYWFKMRHKEENEIECLQTVKDSPSKDRMEREREEKKRKAASEAKIAKEKAEREAEREQKRKQREAELLARKEKAELEQMNRERVSELERQFREGRLIFASDFKEDKQPIHQDGSIFAINFNYRTDRKIYEAIVEKGDITAVRVLSLTEESKDVDVKCFKEMLSTGKVLVKSDKGPIWIYGTGINNWTEKASIIGDEINPAKKELGELYSLLSGMGMMPDLKFRLTLKSKVGGDSTVMGIIGYNETMSRDKIRDVVVKSIQAKREKSINIKPPRLKKFTPTVVLYDGDIIRKEMRVTKVPRTFKHLGSKHHGYVKSSTYSQAKNQWMELKNEAERQESKLRSILENNERAMQEYRNKIEAIIGKMITGEEIEAAAGQYILLIERSRSRLESGEK